ncbi:glycosyltransferase family 4 protein [Terrabacter sp. NPDC000476]|uniref:glycosyltransferase family 4 protein n=1 Tax=Terrabacter sp. NPDC000476 TaxID=3154258 RepID=UPI00331B1B87
MRILLLSHYYEPEVGAPQQRWASLVERFVRAGHEVSVLAPPPHYPRGPLDPAHADLGPGAVHVGRHGETVHRTAFLAYDTEVGSRFADQLVAATSATRLAVSRFRRHRPDVVVATVPSLPMLAAGSAVATALRVPLVVEMRDAWPDLLDVAEEWELASPHDLPAPETAHGAAGDAIAPRPHPAPRGSLDRLRDGARDTARRAGMSAVHRVATGLQRRGTAVVTTTDSFADTLRDRGVRSVHVVRNGAHPLLGWTGRPAREPDGTLRVLYAGTLGRAQGLSTVVKAASLAARAGMPVRVRIVGAGAEGQVLAELARRLDAPVDVRGTVPRAELVEQYAWADSVLVVLRAWRGLSLTVPSKLYEAMSLGVHVSASVAGEAADIVERTGAGHVSPPGDAQALADLWKTLVDDPDRLCVGAGPRDWVREHASDDRLAGRYLDVLHEVVGA